MSDQTFITIRNYYERTVRIDDADGHVVELPVRIRRFALEQLQTFSIDMKRCENRAADRYITRKPDGDEQEKETVTVGAITADVPKVPDSEIRRRRLVEMSADERDRFEALDAEDEKFISEFYNRTVRDHVWVKPGVRLMFEDTDGHTRQISTGHDLAEAFAGQAAILGALVAAVREENTLSPEEKKRLRSPFGSTPGSALSPKAVDGNAPDATASHAGARDFAQSAPATGGSVPLPSGAIAT